MRKAVGLSRSWLHELTSTVDLGLVGLLALLIVAYLTRIVNPATLRDLHPRPDTVEYVFTARNLLERGHFGVFVNDQFLPSRYSIGFPLLIIPAYLARGVTYTNAIFSVLAVDLASIAVAYFTGRRLFGAAAGLYAAAIVTISPLDRTLGQFMLSDGPSGCFVMLSALALTFLHPSKLDGRRFWSTASRRTIVITTLSASVLGYASWIRPINLVYVPVFCLYLVLLFWLSGARDVPKLSSALVPVAVFVVAWSIVQAPTSWYNARTFGGPLRNGYSLWAPYWYDDIRRTFSLSYAIGPSSQALAYLDGLLGLSVRLELTSLPTALYPLPVAALALLGTVATIVRILRRSTVRDDMIRQVCFCVLAGSAILATYVVYSVYFYFSPRFLDVCVLFVAVLASAGAVLLVRSAQSLAKRAIKRQWLASTIIGLAVAAIVMWQADAALMDSPWWRSTILHETHYTASDYELMQLITTKTEANARVIWDGPVVFFSAYQLGTRRVLIPLSRPAEVPASVYLPTFKDRPDLVAQLLQDGTPVYFAGNPDQFETLTNANHFALHLAVSQHVVAGDFDVNLYRVDYNLLSFLSALATAQTVPPQGNAPPIAIRHATLEGLDHRSILEHPAARITFSNIDVTGGTQLVFATGIDPGCLAASAGAHFEVDVSSTGSQSVAFARDMEPRQRPGDRAWIDGRVDLAPWVGQHITLSFVTSALHDDYTCAWAIWGDPAIVGGDSTR